ncbi:hypothetical protein ANN_13280 [Periplaneta americana]|uniref:Uncharacterized protein n=1 Tax=Periplaneta americana TaxID=6978 RepID=A0ABQ8TL71_PERAM|nr:hypothetical protein ANN_13280 [Periplaneta americana]
MTLYCASIYYECITTDRISLEGATLDRVEASDLTPLQHSALDNQSRQEFKQTTMKVLLFQTIAPGILLPPQPVQLSEALNIAYKVSQTVIQNNNSLISEKVK